MTPEERDREFLAGLTVLIAEDDAGARHQMELFLRRRVTGVRSVEDGAAGLAACAAQPPDIVVSDIQMPQLDGLDMIAAIRERHPGMPVVVVTAFERPGYLRRAIELGVDRYVLKPVDAAQLDAALLACARRLRAEQEVARRQQAERDLAQARHGAALALLAAGMAHDYNNLLQAVMGAVTLASEAAHDGRDPRPALALAEQGFGEARELSRRLALLHEHRVEGQREAAIGPLVRRGVEQALAGTGCSADLRVEDDLPAVTCDADQIVSAVSAVVRNATDATTGAGPVAITVRAVPATALDDGALLPRPHVRIDVTDTGHGIDPGLADRIFEPYASSKPRGATKGIGLSLAVTLAIVRMHGGILTVTSAPGKGTTVSIGLPR